MEAKQKAKELFDEMALAMATEKTSDGYFTNVIHAKQCALICVEEVRFFHDSLFYASKGSLFDKYLDNVKQEIEKL